jgi:hypothetical protein
MVYHFVEDEISDEERQPQRFRFIDEEKFPQAENLTSAKEPIPGETAIVSPEEYKNMSYAEKLQYAENLDRDLRYERSKVLSKNIASGATFGATENINALKPDENEDPIAAITGQVIGSALPIGIAGKLVGRGLQGSYHAIEGGPKILKYLTNFAHGFGTGSLYESGKQAVNAASGKEVNLNQIPVTGSEFGTGQALIKALGDVGRRFLTLSPKHQAEILERRIIPHDLPKSQYETANDMIKAMQNQQSTVRQIPFGQSSRETAPATLTNRVTPNGEDLGLRPAPQRETPNLSDEVGNIFSPNRFYNTTQGGYALRNEIMTIDQNVYRGVNELYRVSRDLNSQINEIHPNLAGHLQNRIRELQSIPEPSDVQKRLLRASENILNRIATLDNEGSISGYLPINNQVLIDQVQSLRQIIDYDFAHGNTKNIFRPLINEIQSSALAAAESSGTPEAANAINEARNAYRMWVEAFDNDYVRPFRDNSNQDYSKLFKSSLDLDEHNMLQRILRTTPRGQELINASTREIVEKNISKYFENPRAANSREFDKSIRELEAVISPEQAQQIQERFRIASRRPPFRAKQKIATPTNEEVIAGKYANKEPEDIQRMMNSRSGIKELRKDFSTSEQKKQLFEKLTKQKMRSILREGNIEKDFTGDDLYKFLNKEKNYEIFSEILGEKETEAMRIVAKEIGKAQVKSEVRKKTISKVANKMIAIKGLEFLLGIF